ncbi:SDR family NAD(P)-dependent oxidoreductase [Desulfosudis oleivorans]|uniref:Polysaccharide biosynthesis protein CapD n=1 Tax=Desulfosudis oleivorans (strain DSM 6200 / JCM 39069 / Hxd3) TaxID=96561 RepID=A8ZYA1_DESOH|nr:SDR family NAD(P)-dependent oxidoreductase [Desulfosudis oleivorans]ABW67108.1 polysaccharide biosynthesis protein CapD [Desulfosudis oleivorans Hxd3]
MNAFSDRRVLVTGCCGTVGSELVRQLLEVYGVGELVGIDNNESELFFAQQRFAGRPARFFLADVRDEARLKRLFSGIDIVFHTAAFKHVELCEVSPFEAVQTNIHGVQNVVWAAVENRVRTVVFTSSDKAVNPTNVMGTSKLMGERLMTAANSNLRSGKTVFAATRFGNVLGSRGSVIPIFREQIRKGGPVTLTDPDMTRFIMSIRQAVQLVIDSADIARGGEVFVTKMPVIRIEDLARVMIDDLAPRYGHDPAAVTTEVIGTKAGEKLYEELMTDEETRRSLELARYFVVRPAFLSLYREIDYTYADMISDRVDRPYHSANETPLTQAELRAFLYENNLIEGEAAEPFQPAKRF